MSLGKGFTGHKYVAQYNLAVPLLVTGIRLEQRLVQGHLIVENISLIDSENHAVSVSALTNKNDFAVAFRSHAAMVLVNRDVMPRAFLVHAARTVAHDQIIAEITQPTFQPAREVLVSDGPPLHAAQQPTASQADLVTITEYRPERVTLSAELSDTGYLVLADTWYPGWQARVDGQIAPIYHADYIFRAILLGAGKHEIVFEYQSPSFRLGLVISLLSGVAAIVIAAFGYSRLLVTHKDS